MQRVRHSCRRIVVLACVVSTGHPAFGQAATPPRIDAASAPHDYPELTTHRAPGPLASDAITQDWPCFLGPNRDGRSVETRLTVDLAAGGPPLVWEMRCGDGYAGPVVADDRLVFTHRVGNTVHIDCVDPESGRRHWRVSTPCTFRSRYISNSGPRSTPVIAGGRVFVHAVDGVLRCLDLADGRIVWTRDLAAELNTPDDFFGVVPSPMVHDGKLIQNVGAPGGPTVAAFDVESGRIVWGAGERWGASCASPVIATLLDQTWLLVLAGGDSRPPTGGLMVIEPRSGAVRYEYPFRSRTYESVLGASPVTVGSRIIISAAYNTGTACITAEAGGEAGNAGIAETGGEAGNAGIAETGFAESWSTRRLGLEFSNPIAHDGHVYAIDGRSDRLGALVCLDPATGEERSRTDLAWTDRAVYRGEQRDLELSVGQGSLLFVDGRFLCLGDNGHVLWIDASPEKATVLSRAWLFRANESWTRPVVSHGLLYVCQNNRERFGADPAPPRLLCYDLRRR